MLKKRIMTALILIPLMVLLVLYSSAALFCILTGLILVWAAWEWTLLIGLVQLPLALLFPGLIAVLAFIGLLLPVTYIMYLAFGWWILAFILLLSYTRGVHFWATNKTMGIITGILVLIPGWLAINFIHAAINGPYILLFLLSLIWIADIAAFFTGRQWGTHLLAPTISPGKTWEGVFGGFVASLLLIMSVLWFSEIQFSQWPAAIALGLVTVFFSIIGDLFESMVKRISGLKDSGKLLPGHGGILDRIDSLTAAAPIFVLGALWMAAYYH